MNLEIVLELILEMGSLKFFPTEPAAHLGLVKLVSDMASSEDQVRRVVSKMRNKYNDWPGPLEFRACFCSVYKPLDGITASSSVYPDGIPSDRPELPALAGPPRLMLEPGETPSISQDEINATLASLGRALSMDRRKRLGAVVRELPVNKNFVPFTAEDVERERQKMLTARAEKELRGELG